MSFLERLVPVLQYGDVVAGWELLASLEGEELADAKTWFAGARRWMGDDFHRLEYAGDDHDATLANRCQADWILAMCALRLCGPATAARRVPWRSLWDSWDFDGEAVFVHMLWDLDPDWVAPFVTVAAEMSLGADARNHGQVLSRVLRAAVVHHGLPCPSGRSFHEHWLAGTASAPKFRRPTPDATRDVLRRDPLMPDLLFHFLASGHCGKHPWLPDVVSDLVAEGHVDRRRLVDHVLVLLTGPTQRPKSQTVLVRILDRLEVRAGEVAGGLVYLLGVMATSHGSVVNVLLPWALDLVDAGGALSQLTTVVAGRPEKAPRTTLLTALRSAELQSVAGTPAVLEALEVLGDTDDRAFADSCADLAAALGGAAPERRGDHSTGLWDATPVVGPAPTATGWNEARAPGFAALTDRQFPDYGLGARGEYAHRILSDLAAGRDDSLRDLAGWAGQHLREGRLALGRVTDVLDDVYLAGGLRRGWLVGLFIADKSAAAPRKPAGLAGLLRMLASYAGEVPQQDLTPGIAALAASASTSKAAVEARALGARLARCEVPELLERLRARPDAAGPREVKGLWEQGTAEEPLPSSVRIERPPVDLLGLRDLVAQDLGPAGQDHSDWCYVDRRHQTLTWSGGLTRPDQVLAATVAAIHDHGSDVVRAELAGVDRHPRTTSEVQLAIDLWAVRCLDREAFWRLAGARHHSEVRRELFGDGPSTLSREEHRRRHEQLDALPDLPRALASGAAVVLPASLDGVGARVTFLRACESLLLAESCGVVLSEPTWADGTLDLDDLLRRLRSAAGPVGALDLVQALHRLRPVLVGRADDLELPPLCTSPGLTDSDGGPGWDAAALVAHWVRSGGLPDLDPVAVGGSWSTRAVAPVPWSRCAAAPEVLREDPWFIGSAYDVVRLMPWWADRAIVPAAAPLSYFWGSLPTRTAGTPGVPIHDAALAALAVSERSHLRAARNVVLDLARYERLVPEAAARAAVGRHEAGCLSLGKLTASLRWLFESGGLRGTWASALAIADALTTVSRKPAALAELLALLAAYAHEVPNPVVPDRLVRLAAAGASRAQEEARALVAAVERS